MAKILMYSTAPTVKSRLEHRVNLRRLLVSSIYPRKFRDNISKLISTPFSIHFIIIRPPLDTHSLHKQMQHSVNGIQTQHLHGLMILTNEVACLRIDMACANRAKATSSVFIHPWLLTATTSMLHIPRRLGNICYYSANDCFAARRTWAWAAGFDAFHSLKTEINLNDI